MIWLTSLALVLGLSLAAMRKRRVRSATKPPLTPPEPADLTESRRPKYKVTSLQAASLDQNPDW